MCVEVSPPPCLGSNTSEVRVDDRSVYHQTFVAKSDGDLCTTVGSGLPVRVELDPGTHDVLVTQTSPAARCERTVVVVPGPACDADADGVLNAQDNCPTLANRDQSDIDGDGLGDACDADDDGDGCSDKVDQHPTQWRQRVGSRQVVDCPDDGVVYISESSDSDGDGLPNCADDDDDDDNDGITDDKDGCPIHPFAVGEENICYEIYPPLICIYPLHEPCRLGIDCEEWSGQEATVLPPPVDLNLLSLP